MPIFTVTIVVHLSTFLLNLKQHIPPRLKQFLWFLFKAPQRKWIGYQTVWTDFVGYLSIKLKRKSYKKISICIGVKNRSYNLVEYVVRSLNACEYGVLIELSVYDCGSDDLPDLEAVLRRSWKGSLVYQCVPQAFARTVAFNAAVKQSSSDLVLVCDADMSIPEDIVSKVNAYVTAKSAWFPITMYIKEDGTFRPYTESTGMFASRKQDFIRAGQYDESIRIWGKEDWLLFFAFYEQGIACYRTTERYFMHHYHPSLKPDDFKPLF